MKKFNIIILAAAVALMVALSGCGGGGNSDDPVKPDVTNPDNPDPNNPDHGNPSSKTCTVTFVSNGGSEVASQTVVEGGTAVEPTVPTRKNYVFAGWYTDNTTFTDRVTFPYTVASNVTLYAKWFQGTAIYTADDLNNVRKNLSGSYILMNDISLKDYSADAGWQPIGTFAPTFGGKFDGNGHKITDLTINRPTEQYVGLFGYINGGSVSDLGVETAVGGVNGKDHVGGIAGYVTGGQITNCYSTGSISSSSFEGGIAGGIQNVTIAACYSTGSISSTSNSDDTVCGGIAGCVDNSTITDCYSTGNISSAYTSTGDYVSYSGGIAGSVNNSTITNCYSTGNISSTNTDSSSSHDDTCCGGIAGCVYGSSGSAITNCYSMGSISSSSVSEYSYSGGIAGLSGATITDCYSTGSISSSSTYLWSSSGGIAGLSGATITDCYSTGNISSSSTAPSSNSSYSSYSGGIAGENHSIITDSYSTGNIFSSSTYSSSYSGGIAGHSDGTITNSYSAGSISSTTSISIYSSCGGIAGSSSGSVTNCAAINPTIKAITSGVAKNASAGRIVCLIGTNTIINNFALTDMKATGGTFNSAAANYGVSKSDTQLRTQSTYSDAPVGDGQGGLGWKFGNSDDAPWKVPSGGGGYPILYWQ